jgi:hypothetical protein
MTFFLSAFRKDKRLLWFMIVWLLINVVQAIFTELAHDEAYYWMYARKLAIGYYDHPPMIALMIRMGGLLLHGEIGVRLLVVVMSAASIPLLYSLCEKKDFPLFVFLFTACTVFQVYGFIAVPDAPLLFFTILFFVAYKKYLLRDSLTNAVILAVVIAMLLYSKYHGILVVFFTVASNLKLWKQKTFYLIIVLTALFYFPHILWQIQNDYPSYQYHVLNKSQTSYNVADSFEFMGATVLVAGPLTGILMLIALWKNRSKDLFRRSLKFTFWGFVIFFFVSTFNSAIEANWMAASVVPLFVPSHEYISENVTLRKWAVRLSLISLVLFSFFRLNLMTDMVPALGSKPLPEFFGWKKWAEEIEKHADGCPVVIMNSYQRASKYSFYTNSEALSLNNMAYRRNQYDSWDIADSIQGRRIALFRAWDESADSLESFETPRGKFMVVYVDHFRSYSKYRIITDKEWYTFPHSSDVEIPLDFFNDGPTVQSVSDSGSTVSLVYWRYHYADYDGENFITEIEPDTVTDGMKKVIHIRTPDKPGPYYLRFGFRSGWMPPYINSHLIRMDIE